MYLRTEHIPLRMFAGKRVQMSFSNNKTLDLWKSFMPAKKEISGVVGSELYSMEDYGVNFFEHFNPNAEFDKWAAVEVVANTVIPTGMETLQTHGLYAIFLHKGLVADAAKLYRYIYSEWIPASEYVLDNRPHFAVMGDKYKNNDPLSEEEIWIPIRLR